MGQPFSATFSRLTQEDIPAVRALEQQCFPLPWSESQFRTVFTQDAFTAYGLRYGTELAAYIALYRVLDEIEILNIAVHPSCRRQGYGKRLLGTLLQEARKMGITKAVLEVRTGNAPARALYEKLGFVQTGLRRHYYKDTGEDALLYDCHLS